MRLTPLLCLPFATLLHAQAPDAARVDRGDALRHYATVEAELRRAPQPSDAAVAARRLEVIEHLRAYRERADFGVNPHPDGSRVPLFVDDAGRRCAVAWLLDRTGHGDLTLDIHHRCNQAWVAELVGDTRLVRWLDEHGLTAAEAARIQVPGSPPWGDTPPPAAQPPGDRPERPDAPTGDTTRPTGPTTGGSAGGSAPAGPSTGNPTAAPRAPGGAGGATTPRGLPLTAMATSTWSDWWAWHRDSFELPQDATATTNAPTSAVAADQHAAETLLRELTRAPDASLRAAAVQALGRTGAAIDLAPFLEDGAREVRLAALLGLGSSGNATNTYELLTRTGGSLQGETLAVALAGTALLEEGAARRSLAREVARHMLDADPSVRAAAALAAAGHSDAQRHEIARALLGDEDRRVRAEAAQLLGPGAETEDVARLTALASDRDVAVRRAAALALGRSRHDLALPALQTAYELEHEPETQAAQLLAIGDHGGAAAGPFLLEALRRGRKPMRGYAALGLALWGRGRDAATEAEAVATAFTAERNRDQQGAYLLALGILRHAPARTAMQEHLRTSQNSSTRGAAAAALGLLGDRAAMPALRDALAGDSCPWVRAQAARAVAQLGTAAVDVLIATLRDDKDATVQGAAAVALGGLRDERAATALLAFAADAEAPTEARAGAVLGLGRRFRRGVARLPTLRFQRDHRHLPPITAWAFAQEL